MNTLNQQAFDRFNAETTMHNFNQEQILNSLRPNEKEMRKATFKAVIASQGMDPNGFLLGATLAFSTGVSSLGVGAILGINAGGVNNAIGLAAATVAGGIATKVIDDPYISMQVAMGLGFVGTQAAAHTSSALRTPKQVFITSDEIDSLEM